MQHPICKGEACGTQDNYMNSMQILVGRLKKKLDFQT